MFDFIMVCLISLGAINIMYGGWKYIKNGRKISGGLVFAFGILLYLFMAIYEVVPPLFTLALVVAISCFYRNKTANNKNEEHREKQRTNAKRKLYPGRQSSSRPVAHRQNPQASVSSLQAKTNIRKEKYPIYDLTIHKKRKQLTNYVVVDIETTGLDAPLDKIIQLSALKVVDSKITDSFNTYINPGKENLPLPHFIEELTGISSNELKDAPSFEQIKDSFLRFTKGYPWVGHNIIKFDIPFLYKSGLGPKEYWAEDTYLLARKKLNRRILGNLKLETLKKYYHIPLSSHDSLDDCKTTMIVYEHFKEDSFHHFLRYDEKLPSFEKMNFVIIGNFPEIDKTLLIEQIENRSGNVDTRVLKRTDYVLKGITDKEYKSLSNVQKWGTNIINYSDFVKLTNKKDKEYIARSNQS